MDGSGGVQLDHRSATAGADDGRHVACQVLEVLVAWQGSSSFGCTKQIRVQVSSLVLFLPRLSFASKWFLSFTSCGCLDPSFDSFKHEPPLYRSQVELRIRWAHGVSIGMFLQNDPLVQRWVSRCRAYSQGCLSTMFYSCTWQDHAKSLGYLPDLQTFRKPFAHAFGRCRA